MTDTQLPRRCRILALDGGGMKGAFTAAVLHELERMANRRIADSFDLITGTSTGGIIALGLGLGLDMASILELYASKGPRIFPPSPRFMLLKRPRGWIWSKFRPDGLTHELTAAFGDRVLGESSCRLVIPAFNADDGDVKLIKTSHHDRLRRDHRLRAVDVALATSAAPTYFPAHQVAGDLALVDGGVWANCPALVGVIEAITVLEVDRADIDVLSVGTTDEPYHIPRRRRTGGKVRWARHAPDLLMRASAVGSLAQAELLTRRYNRSDGLMRLNSTAQQGRFEMDSTDNVDHLVALGRKTAEHNAEEVLARFLATPADRFIPVHTSEPTAALVAHPA